jgi:hypothetical protein
LRKGLFIHKYLPLIVLHDSYRVNSSRALASSHSVGGSVSLAMVAINKNVMHLAQNLSTPDLCCSFCIKGIFIHKYSPLIALHDSYRVNRSKALATKSGQ